MSACVHTAVNYRYSYTLKGVSSHISPHGQDSPPQMCSQAILVSTPLTEILSQVILDCFRLTIAAPPLHPCKRRDAANGAMLPLDLSQHLAG